MKKCILGLTALVLLASATIGATAIAEQVNASQSFTLQLLHFADIDGQPEALDNVENFARLVNGFRSQYPENTLVLSSGDNYIPGPRYVSASDESMTELLGVPGNGRGDIAFLNALGVKASAVGNHDLDEGTEAFAGIIAPESPYPGALFPYLSSNLDFSTDENLSGLVGEDYADVSELQGKLAAAATVEVNGEIIGIVGASTPSLPSITSTGGITVETAYGDVAALAAEIQESVDGLRSMGVNKIVLLSHMQRIQIEEELASLLDGVDIIVAGGSNSVLADLNDQVLPGSTVYGRYPITSLSASREPVLVVNTDGDYRYLGRLVVEFDADGVISMSSLDSEVNGAYASTDENAAMYGGRGNFLVEEVAAGLRSVLQAKEGNVLGVTSVYLDGRRSQVRTQETNLGNLTADANLWYAQQFDPTVQISLKNGGGIRADIGDLVVPPGSDNYEPVFQAPGAISAAGKPEGGISQFDIETTLRFNNGLVIFNVTGAELYDIAEHAISAWAPGVTAGSFPQIAGFSFSFDPNGPARQSSGTNQGVNTTGGRIVDLSVGDFPVVVGGQLVAPNAVFRMVTLNFLAKNFDDDGSENGEEPGDGYPFNGLSAPLFTAFQPEFAVLDPGLSNFADTASEQDALAEYLQAMYPDAANAFSMAETSAEQDMRIRNLSLQGK